MTIILTPTAVTIVKADVSAFKRDGKRYASYVTEMNVTVENLPEHVGAFRDAFKAATPKATPEQIKAYATKVRNGLKYNLTAPERATVDTDYLKAVVKATLTAAEHGITAEQIAEAIASALA